jgi:hypothetical protein
LAGNPEYKFIFEEVGVDGRITLRRNVKWKGVDWIHLAQDRNK